MDCKGWSPKLLHQQMRALFKSDIWAEIKMITEEVDEALYQKAKALFYNSSEAEILQRCRTRSGHP